MDAIPMWWDQEVLPKQPPIPKTDLVDVMRQLARLRPHSPPVEVPPLFALYQHAPSLTLLQAIATEMRLHDLRFSLWEARGGSYVVNQDKTWKKVGVGFLRYKPEPLPLYNSSEYQEAGVALILPDGAGEWEFQKFVAVVAMHMAQVVLHTTYHPLQHTQGVPTIAAMMWGFRDFYLDVAEPEIFELAEEDIRFVASLLR